MNPLKRMVELDLSSAPVSNIAPLARSLGSHLGRGHVLTPRCTLAPISGLTKISLSEFCGT